MLVLGLAIAGLNVLDLFDTGVYFSADVCLCKFVAKRAAETKLFSKGQTRGFAFVFCLRLTGHLHASRMPHENHLGSVGSISGSVQPVSQTCSRCVLKLSALQTLHL